MLPSRKPLITARSPLWRARKRASGGIIITARWRRPRAPRLGHTAVLQQQPVGEFATLLE
jgi:hypothetical protein